MERTEERGLYPPPPPYHKLYTDDAKAAGDTGYWVPPEPILPPNSFEKFGEPQSGTYYEHQLPPDCSKLYDDSADNFDVVKELRGLNQTVLKKYIELLNSLLIVEGKEVEGRVSDITNHFMNMTLLINQLRAFQARQTVVSLMAENVKSRNAKAEALERQASQAQQYLASHGLHYEGDALEPVQPEPGMSLLKPTTSETSSTPMLKNAGKADLERAAAWADCFEALDRIR